MWRIAQVCLLVLFAVVTRARAEEFRLANGLRIVLADDPRLNNVALAVSYNVGFADDPPQYRGLAHLVEHLTFRDARRPDSSQTMDLIEAAGGGSNAITSIDRTVYFEVLPRAALELGLWVESQRMGFALAGIDDKALRLEKKIVYNELALREASLPWRMGTQRDRSLYGPSHPYAVEDDAAREDTLGATLPGVQWFFQRHYRPDNATLVLVGAFDPKQVRPLIEQYFGPIVNPRTPHSTVEVPRPKQCGVHRVELTHYFGLGRYVKVTWTLQPPRNAAELMSLRALQLALDTRLTEQLVQGSFDAASVSSSLDHRKTHTLLEVELKLHETADFAKVEERAMAAVSELARTQLSEQDLRALRGVLTTQAVLGREDGLRRALAITRGFDSVDNADLAGAVDAATISRGADQLLRERLVLTAKAKESQNNPLVVRDEVDPCR